MDDIYERAVNIRLVIFDVDGVLTDGRLYFGAEGDEYKTFHVRDGLGMNMLQASDVSIGIITARRSKAVALRMEALGVEYVYQGQQNKVPAFEDLLKKAQLEPKQVAYVGDDIIDLPIMRRVGLAIAVADAEEQVKQQSHWQTVRNGGCGAARDACELIMKAQGTLDAQFEKYISA